MANLTEATVSFHTNDENKDHDTNVTVEVRDRNGQMAARVSDTFGAFNDHTNNGPYNLSILNHASKDDLQGGNVLLRVDPVGDDTWRFNLFVDLLFADGSHLTATADGLEVNEESEQQQTFGLN
ncbi:hypothetical protein E6W39_10445 [Kitasatospora acidiphila]|uniref:Uncharacterized protein n=1 Tax=Kitasatospora acidiphila TaxID=2567942 RepID=A0A540W0X3_9ACTN|nr:hypothetical protein [Kitasatospora acidiphila]TQF02607.1 hypothetical protein E6W39_10445 [Kitasatospora acidiphila]